jgi:hypothetical protein
VNSFGQNRVSLEGRKIPGGVAQPGDRQEILGKLSIPFVALLSFYSPEWWKEASRKFIHEIVAQRLVTSTYRQLSMFVLASLHGQ